ncbi:MAG: hypothetical protein KZQ83_04800 [gamma proteobacterium symbiont of Taylorina sp.]|nr:hypothetical protein [gamma proteobacterium symbiont of Taylorina sp.]
MMNIKIKSLKKTIYTSFFTACIAPQNLLADEISFIPRTWIGVSDYSFDQAPRKGAMPDGSDFPEVKFDATLLVAGIGLTSVYDHFFLDLSYQDSSEETDSFSGANYYEKFEGDRRDYSTTLGMKILDYRGAIYIGYKNGKTSGRGKAGTRLTFEEDGLFIGASYGWIIANTGLLSINTAYADLDGKLKEVPGSRYPSDLHMDADSEATGLSYGLSWNAKISKKMSYSINLDANDYTFKNLKDNSATKALPNNVEESIFTGKISISYRF